jgi:uncharacterized protein YukE
MQMGVFNIDTALLRQFASAHGTAGQTAQDTISTLNGQHQQVASTLDPQSAASLETSHQAVTKALLDLHNAHINYQGTLNQIATQTDELKAAAQKGFGQIHTQ